MNNPIAEYPIPMRLLRPDLLVTPTVDPPGCSVRDERTGKVYEFGAVEKFLLTRLRQPYRAEELSEACNRRFDANYGSEDIEEFIDMLAGWKLLGEDGQERFNGDAAPDTPDVSETGDSEGNVEEQTPASEIGTVVRRPNGWHLFNPEGLLDGMVSLLHPFRILLWLVPVVFAFGTLAILYHWSVFVDDLIHAFIAFGPVGRLVMEAFTVNLADQLARGMAARRFGLATPSFGLMFIAGFIPRFNVQVLPTGKPSRRIFLWLSGAPMLMRFLLFGASSMVWYMTRPTGSFLASFAVETALLAAVAILLSSNPLWRGDGPMFVSALLGIPNIEQRRHRAFLSLFVRQPAVIARHSKHRVLYGLLGLLSLVFLVGVAGFLLSHIFLTLEEQFRGAGVAVFLVMVGYATFSIQRMVKARREVNAPAQAPGVTASPGFEAATLRGSLPGRAGNGLGLEGDAGRRRWGKWVKYTLLIAFVVCLFLPYAYHAGGKAEVFPNARASLSSEKEGIIDEVMFEGGEWVEAGTTLARMSDYRQLRELRASEATMASKQYEIERLRTTPSPEEIELGEAQLESARLALKYGEEELKRLTSLYESGGMAVQDYEDLREDIDLKRQKFVEAGANLAALKAQVNENQIASLEAEVEKLRHDIAFAREQLRRTALTTPIAGRIVTKNLPYRMNSFLKEGEVFAEIEDTRTVMIEISVPESDIGEVAIGAPVGLRLWAYPDREFEGVVDAIQPAALETEFGSTVTVTSRFENPDGLLKGGLTGHAKIRGETTIVAVAFTRALVRFVLIEVWSWLP